jgi:glycosyltransferase involved in cell wall biosynthesis
VRIGIDLLGVQSPASRGRGIGRYARSLVAGLLRRGAGHEFVLYEHDGLPADDWATAGAPWRRAALPARDPRGEAFATTLGENPDAIDALLVLSPFELRDGYDPPARPPDGPALAAVVYDLIPFRQQERYLDHAPIAMAFYRKLERLRGYDRLLGISEATAADARDLLGLDGRRVAAIGGASDPSRFFPPATRALPAELAAMGIDRPFLLSVASTDRRKNLEGLFDAFARLPEPIRAAHRVVVACALGRADRERVVGWAAARGVAGSLVLTGEVSDERLRSLYQHCALLAFPSRAEGFGLPILEAMQCGAPVVAGANSAQPEVAGDAALLVNVEDPAAIAEAIGRVLTDADLAAALRERGPVRAARFSWDAVADRALGAMSAIGPGPRRASRPRRVAGRIAGTPPARRLRIGVDLLAMQSPGSRGRGVGRYARGLLHAMARRGAHHEFVLYRYDGLPCDDLPDLPVIDLAPAPDGRTARNDLLAANPDGLDVFLTLNPFEQVPRYEPPARPVGGPAVVSVLYDLIPFRFSEQYLKDRAYAEASYRKLALLRGYDRLLAISESTRRDAMRLLGLPASRVVRIGGAADASRFGPAGGPGPDLASRRALHRAGVTADFLLCVAGGDERKNVRGLIEAFARLPEPLRQSHQLVVVCALRDDLAEGYRHHARLRGVDGALVLTGEVDDATLGVLYRRCALFAFPSRYEGLGLPILEAMACGAPVVAGDNSAQPEVVGDVGLLASADEPDAFAAAMARVLEEPTLNAELRGRGPRQAASYTWDDTADRSLAALEEAAARPRRARPRLAVVSPFPPKGSGIADYAMQLVDALSGRYAIELVHDEGYVPEPGLDARRMPCVRAGLFARRARVLGYRGVLYQMGNSFYHGAVYDLMRAMPGVVTLHDFNLAAFQFWRAHQQGDGLANFRRELAHCYPDRPELSGPDLLEWATERGGLQEACARRQLHLNRRVFEAAEAVIVHSPWCLEQVRRELPEHAAKTTVIRLGADPAAVDPAERAATRARFGLPADALVLGSFGILTQGKMFAEAIAAFDAIADAFPHALLVFVGADWENGAALGIARALGREDRVRFLGRQPDDAFEALVRATDIGVMLRRPPTYGETSAALLDLMRHGVPAIVTDVATFSDYPDEVVRKVRWGGGDPGDEAAGLVAAMRELATDAPRRAALGAAARAFVAGNATWEQVAAGYAEVIERVHESRGRAHRAG